MKIAICAIGRLENNYIREWVEHHKKIGFDNIILYDNNRNGEDDFHEVINDYINSGFVILHNYRDKIPTDNYSPQSIAYNECYKLYSATYDWIAFIDCDEFIFLENENEGIKHLLSKDCFKKYPIVRLYWKNYTDDNIVNVVDNDFSLVKRFNTYRNSVQGKSIVRTKLNLKNLTPHGTFETFACDSNGCKCLNQGPRGKNLSILGKTPVYKNAWINHYRTKTIEEFIKYKLHRLYPDQSERTAKLKLNINTFFELNEKTPEKINFLKKLGYKIS